MGVLYVFVVVSLGVLISASDYDGPWRKSLDNDGSCWTLPVEKCNRALTISHGGDWNAQYPYDSMPAFVNAYNNGADTVKGDFRVSGDNVGMVMHSSPIEFYESLNCWGQYVEKMTETECEKCKMALTDYTFISVPTFLSWALEKVNVMLCVKEHTDIPRAISTLVESNATHRAFLEIGLGDFLGLETNTPAGWDQVYYVVNIHGSADVTTLLAASSHLLSRGFLVEFNDFDSWGDNLKTDIASVKAAGLRTMAATKDSPVTATVQNHLDLYNAGIDVAYTYNLGNAVEARIQVNTERGLTPP